MKKKKVVIIGAGPAGLTSAYSLLKKSKEYEVVILESSNQVGGISKTINFNGYKMDTGIHRFFTKSEEVQNIWEELMPIQGMPAYDDIILSANKNFVENGSNPEKDDVSFLIKNRLTRIFYDKKFYDYPVSINYKTMKSMGFFTVFKAGLSYLKSCFIKLEESSLENFYINRFGKVLYSMFFEKYTEKVWGIHPRNISADWGSQRVKGLSILGIIKDYFNKLFKRKNKKNTETSLIESFYYPKLGSGQMFEIMAKKIEEMGGKIILLSHIESIKTDGNRITSIMYENNKKKIKIACDICISSMPIKDLIESLEMKIPKKIYDIAVNLPYREFMSVGLVVDKFNIKNNTKIKTIGDIVPDSWIYIQDPSVKMGRIQIFNNWSPYIFKNAEDMEKEVFFSMEYFCSKNDRFWNMNDDEFIKFAINEAKKINLIDNDCKIKDSCRIKIKKAYPAYFGTYKDIDNVISFLNKIDNLYCVGRNGQHRYNNMDHSMLTGIFVSDVILNNGDKDSIWHVNTEKEYHEIKK